MKIIKLNAIDSTNTFLKNLANDKQAENFTIVVAEHQTNGKGQRGSDWLVDSGKNLTFSVLCNFIYILFERKLIISIFFVLYLK